MNDDKIYENYLKELDESKTELDVCNAIANAQMHYGRLKLKRLIDGLISKNNSITNRKVCLAIEYMQSNGAKPDTVFDGKELVVEILKSLIEYNKIEHPKFGYMDKEIREKQLDALNVVLNHVETIYEYGFHYVIPPPQLFMKWVRDNSDDDTKHFVKPEEAYQ